MATASNIATLEAQQEDFKSKSHWQRAFERLMRDRLTLAALAVLIGLILFAYGAEIWTAILNIDPIQENLSKIYAQPDSVNLLGTDDKGRDHLARLMYGGQVSLAVAFFASTLSMTIGVTMGMITGYFGGVVDDLIIWFITTLNSIPQLFLLLIIAAIFDPSPTVFIIVLGLLGWPGILRLVRGETLSIREQEYIYAARAMGASNLRIMFQHIFPNLISIVIITMAIDIGGLILTESALSFLGFGIVPPTPTWGNMLSDSQSFFRKAPHLVIAPGLLISITVLCLYVIGDGFRDALDPTAQN